MAQRAVVFPGQGSQEPGMARAWLDHPAFRRWEEADALLGWDVTRLGLEADADELRQPRNCQIALFVHHAVLLDAWATAAGEPPTAVAGHSLGEYNALVAAGLLTFSDALRLVDVRARATERAAAGRPGSMVACLGAGTDAVVAACRRSGAFIANDNAPAQIVVAGSQEALARFADELAEGRVAPLNVGAAYHSPHMEPAVAELRAALAETRFRYAAVPIVANVDAEVHIVASEWPGLLARQLVSAVRWRETVPRLRSLGVSEAVELCASPVLGGLIKRTDPGVQRRALRTPDDLSAGVAT